MRRGLVGRRLKTFCRTCDGNIAWIYALALIPLTMATGGVVDLVSVLNAKGSLQSAIDAATLAGAGANNSETLAAQVFAGEQHSDFGTIGTPSFRVNDDASFTGTVSVSVQMAFLPLINVKTLNVTVSATAKHNASSTVCVLVLDNSASQSLTVNSGADIEAPNCEIHVASTGYPAAIFNSNSTLNSMKICIAGSTVLSNGGLHPGLATSCTVAADPFAGQLPVPDTAGSSCNGGNYNGGSVTLTPGVYCGWYNFNNAPSVTFQPGVYVIKNGGWNVNGGSWSGEGVTFYFADTSKIQFNSGVKATLSAPTSGTYAGILMYEAAGLSKTQFIFDDSKGHKLSGLIYLPSRQVIFNAGADTTADPVTLVVDTLLVNQATWHIMPATTGHTIEGKAGSGAYLAK